MALNWTDKKDNVDYVMADDVNSIAHAVQDVEQGNTAMTFSQSSSRTNITSGDPPKTMFGKIRKWFADLKTVAFTGNYSDLTNTPSSLPASDVSSWAKQSTKPSYTKSEVGLGNVPNVATNDQTPTFTAATSRSNISSGDKLSVIFGKLAKWYTDLKTVAFTGNYTDLLNRPSLFSGSYNDLTDKPNIPPGVVVDPSLDGTSSNPVQNKAVKAAIDTVEGKVTTETTAREIAVDELNKKIEDISSGNIPEGSISVDTLGDVRFTEAAARENIQTGEMLKTLFGKIAKWYTELKNVAWTGSYNDLADKPSSFNPTSHASTGTTYGKGDGTHYGHLMLSDSTVSESDVSGGIAATPSAVKVAYDLAKQAYDKAGSGGSAGAVNYAECSTSGSTAAKTVTITGFALVAGARVSVKFTNAHTSSTAATLNVSSTTAKTIRAYDGSSYANVTSSFSWKAGEIVEMIYDGSNWIVTAASMDFAPRHNIDGGTF